MGVKSQEEWTTKKIHEMGVKSQEEWITQKIDEMGDKRMNHKEDNELERRYR